MRSRAYTYRDQYNLSMHDPFGVTFRSAKVQLQQGNHANDHCTLKNGGQVGDTGPSSPKTLRQQRDRHSVAGGNTMGGYSVRGL